MNMTTIELIVLAAGIWLTAYMIFWANPLNNPTLPDGEMNPHSRENWAARKTLEADLLANGETEGPVIFWYHLKPIYDMTLTAAFMLTALMLCRVL